MRSKYATSVLCSPHPLPIANTILKPLYKTNAIVQPAKLPCSYFSWVSAVTGMFAFILYLPGIFVEHSVLDKDKEEEKDKVPEMMAPKKNPRELLKQLSIISVVDSTNIRTFDEFKVNDLGKGESGEKS